MATGMTPNHNLSIPPLIPGERIANWKPLFLAAVAPLIEQKAEHKAIQILPAFIRRRPAERELVREVVIEERTLQEAFDILIESLDPPQDPQQQMLALADPIGNRDNQSMTSFMKLRELQKRQRPLSIW